MQDDGTLFTIGQTNLTEYLAENFGTLVSADQVRPLYPGLTDPQIIAGVDRDFVFLCPAQLWSAAVVGAGVANVYRYSRGLCRPSSFSQRRGLSFIRDPRNLWNI